MKKKISKLAFFLFLLMGMGSLLGFVLHPFHVSSTEILYGTENTLEVHTRIFTDDFEKMLAKIYPAKIDLSNPKMHAEMDILVEKYLISALKIGVNQKNIRLKYLGYEIDREATQIYLETAPIAHLKSIKVENTILFQLFTDQNNIVHIVVNGKRKSQQMPYPTTIIEQTF